MPVGHTQTVTDVLERGTEVTSGSLVTTIGIGTWVNKGAMVGWGAQAVTHNRISVIRESFIIKSPFVGLVLIQTQLVPLKFR